MTYGEKLRAVADRIGRKAVLEQLVEECGELVQAAAKQFRIYRGVNYTPVGLSENTNSLFEEAADVSLCIDALAASFGADLGGEHGRIEETKARKLARWVERLMLDETEEDRR